MTVALVVPLAVSAAPLALVDEAEQVRRFAEAATSSSTLASYRRDLRLFEVWCRQRRLEPFPAEPATVATYISDMACRGKKAGTIGRHLSSISVSHKRAGLTSPVAHDGVRTVWEGIRRSIGTAKTRKAACTIDQLVAMLETIDEGLLGLRDRALLLVGFAGALRRSELVALDVEDLVFVEGGLDLYVRRSKTDQEGEGALLEIAYGQQETTCPVRALRRWLAVAGIVEGPAFRSISRHGNISETRLSAQTVALVVKRRCSAAGLDSTLYSGHSLRAGFATQISRSEIPESRAMEHTRHKSERIFRTYVREGRRWRNPVSAHLGL